MGLKLIGCVVSVLLSLCDSAFVDTIKKCSFKDDKCYGKTIQNVLTRIGSTGIPELNMPPIDPMDLSGLSIPIVGFVNVLIEEGSVTGLKDCEIKHIHNDFDVRSTDMDLICDLTVKAKFKLTDISSLIQNLFGAEAVSGNGNMVLKIDRIRIKMKFFYDIVKRDDGNIYYELHPDDVIGNFDIGNLKMTANKILIGKQDISGFFETLFNQNWKSLIPTFGTSVFQVAVTIVKNTLGNFFDKVPSKDLYIEDATPYLNKP